MKTTRLGLRETILRASTRDEVEDCIAAADRCTHMSRKTRNGIRNAAKRRRDQLSGAETTRFQQAVKAQQAGAK